MRDPEEQKLRSQKKGPRSAGAGASGLVRGTLWGWNADLGGGSSRQLVLVLKGERGVWNEADSVAVRKTAHWMQHLLWEGTAAGVKKHLGWCSEAQEANGKEQGPFLHSIPLVSLQFTSLAKLNMEPAGKVDMWFAKPQSRSNSIEKTSER